ncbi:MAG: hypothetical protein J6K91_05800 [Opitutales bacterium]|nr:hypothetical protein [Opitutales bacterium]
MSRYRRFEDLDDQCFIDGDVSFVGMKSLQSSSSLEAGFVALAKNVRFDSKTIRVRKGCIAQSLGVELDNPPLVLPFVLKDGLTIHNDYTDGARCAGSYYGDDFAFEELELCVSGSPKKFGIIYRGRDYTLNIPTRSQKRAFKEFLVEVFADKIYFFDTDEGFCTKILGVPKNTFIPDNSNICILQAVNRLIIFRGADENGRYLPPLYWEPNMERFEVVPDAKAYYSIPCAEFGLFADNRLVVPMVNQRIDIEKIVCTNGNVSVQTSLDHGLHAGDKIVISNANYTVLNGVQTITSVSESVWDEQSQTYTTLPTFEFDINSDASFTEDGSPEARYDSRDEYVVSGLLEPFEYDLIDGHFRPEMGSANYIVGFAPYQNNSIIVFMRKSIYIHKGLDSLASSTISLITREVGCIARNTICTVGNHIYFLSDEGVSALSIDSGELSLIGSSEPLSKDIDDWIKRINISAAKRACALYCNNRYYLAAPIDDSERNNVVFVYNMVNQAWESVDEYPNSLSFDYLVAVASRGKKRVFACSREGGVVMLEERNDGDEGGVIADENYGISPVKSEVITRAYHAQNPELKRFNRIQADVAATDNENFSLSVKIEDPDCELSEKFYTADRTQQSVIRRAVRANAHRLQIIFKTSSGRPELRRTAVDASVKTSDNRRL